MEIEAFEQQEMFEVKKEMTFIKTFTRNLEETTHQFPDIIGAANKRIDAKSVILDGEAVGYNKKTGKFLPFQETIQRKRKHGVSAAAKKIPLKYMVFDILFLNGKSLVDEPLTKRRKLLDSIIKADKIIQIDKYVQTGDAAKVAKFHKEALDKGLEGIMVKRVSSPYQAGARNFAWVKLKKLEEQILSDTVDCVVLGYYHGRGARAKFGIGGFLVAIWDEKDNKYKTLTKVGSGLKDNDWAKLKEIADKIAVKGPPKNADINKKYNCDVWIKPEIVVEIAADEVSKSSDHSVGYALRFPRLIKFRKDRKPKDTTTPKEIEHMYEIQ
jgi:DNA ligase-1